MTTSIVLIILPYFPAIAPLGITVNILQRDVKSVFTAALLTKAKLEKQPRCPMARIDKHKVICMYTYTVEFSFIIRENKIMPFAGILVQLEIIIVSKLCQAQANIFFLSLMFSRFYMDTQNHTCIHMT